MAARDASLWRAAVYSTLTFIFKDATTMETKILTSDQAWEFAEGTWTRAYEVFGAHRAVENGQDGWRFDLWAPGARSVRLTGSFCDWDPNRYFMEASADSGVWHIFMPGLNAGESYK